MGDNGEALLKFCAAQRELTQIDDATSLQRRQHTRGATAFRDLIKDQLASANATCVPVMCGGKQKYAVLRQAVATTSVTKEAVMQALRSMRYEMHQASTQHSKTLEEWVEGMLRTALTPPTDAAQPSRRRPPTLSLVVKKPDAAEPSHVHPATMSKIQETVDSLHASCEASKALRKKDEVRRKELRKACKEAEESVAKHLEAHDPEYGTRRVRLVQGKNEATCYLRRKSVNRTSRPTMRTALPAIRQIIRTLREEAGVEAPPTFNTYRWLVSPPTLAALERHIGDCLERLHTEKTSTRVVLTSV